MLTYIIIIFVVCMALAPLSHFAPSKRQRQKAQMREYAAVHGLFVELRKLPPGVRRPADLQGEIIYYGKRFPLGKSPVEQSSVWQREEAGWRAVGHRRHCPAILEELPAAVLAASSDVASCGIYWVEPAELAQVEHACACIAGWTESMLDAAPESPEAR